MGHFRFLGGPNGQHLVPDGGPLCFPAHPPTPLGRVPIKVLQGRRTHICPILLQVHPEAGRRSGLKPAAGSSERQNYLDVGKNVIVVFFHSFRNFCPYHFHVALNLFFLRFF